MPVIRVDMLAGRTQQQKNEIADIFTRELARVARCGVGDVQIIFNDVERRNWSVAGVIREDGAPAKEHA